MSGALYGIGATALGVAFVGSAVRVWFDTTARSARRMFGFSIVYLFLLFVLLIADKMLGGAV